MDMETKLCKFFEDKDINLINNQMLVLLPFNEIEEFTHIIGYDYFSKGVKTDLLYNLICFDLVPICVDFDINPNNIIKRK